MLVLFFPFLAWLLFSNVNTSVPAPADFEPVMETVQEDSDYYESVALKTVELIDGDAPYSYYTVTQDVAEPGLYSYEYAFSEKGILYYILNKEENGRYSSFLRRFDAYTGELIAGDIGLINSEYSYEVRAIARKKDGYFAWAYNMDLSEIQILSLSMEGDILSGVSFEEIVPLISAHNKDYAGNSNTVKFDSMTSDGRNVYISFDGNYVSLNENLDSVISLYADDSLCNVCIGTDGMLYFNDSATGNIYTVSPLSDRAEPVIAPFRADTKLFPDFNNKLLITDGDMIRTLDPYQKKLWDSFKIASFGLCEVNIDDIFRDNDGCLHIVFREQKVAYDIGNGSETGERYVYFVPRMTVLVPEGVRARINRETPDPYCDGKYEVKITAISDYEPEYINPLPRIVSEDYLYISQRKDEEDGDWLLRRDLSGKGRPEGCYKLEVGEPGSSITTMAWASGNEFIAYAYDIDSRTGEEIEAVVRMTADGKLIKKKLISELPELYGGELWRKPVSDGKNTYIVYGTNEFSCPVMLDKDFNFVRKFPVSYSRNGFDDEGLLYLLDQASGLISYYDSKTDTFTEDVNYVIRYPDEMFGGGHKEVIIRKNSCFFSYSSEDGITEKLFDGIDYGMDMENVYGCYRDGDDSIVVVYKGYWNSLDVYENSYDRDFWDEGVFKAVFTKAKADTQDEPADTSASLE